MATEILYLPVSNGQPVAVDIKGHRMLILAKDEETLQIGLDKLGAEAVQKIEIGETQEEQMNAIQKLAQKVKGGVIVTPMHVDFEDVMINLNDQLPWVH